VPFVVTSSRFFMQMDGLNALGCWGLGGYRTIASQPQGNDGHTAHALSSQHNPATALLSGVAVYEKVGKHPPVTVKFSLE